MLAYLLATQLSRTAKHSEVKDVKLREIFVLLRSGIVISFLFVAKVNFLFKNQKVYSGKHLRPHSFFQHHQPEKNAYFLHIDPVLGSLSVLKPDLTLLLLYKISSLPLFYFFVSKYFSLFLPPS